VNDKLPPDFVARATADIAAAMETDDLHSLLREVGFHRMGPLFAVAGIDPHAVIGREIATSLMATVMASAEVGIHAYLAYVWGVPLEDVIEALLPEAEGGDHAPADDLAEAIRAALERFLEALGEDEDDDYPFADDFERAAYREVKAEFKALDHSECDLGHCTQAADPVPEIERRAAARRAAAVPATETPRTPEQQDRRYPGLPRGSDD
jgi:hypothetical protein